MSFKSKFIAIGVMMLFVFSIKAQQLNSSEIYHELQKFKSPYRVLYLAAHPDDENTRLISFFGNELNARTAYLSLTRGDGGQNLIGNEKGALLGVLRTQELLSARKIDGGEQFFTRAVDFGYSKADKETFEFWGKDEILSDVVYVIRHFKPHIIINRFPTNNYSGHGHHLASALLSEEAFQKSSDETVFPEQLDETGIWQTGSLFLNTSSWWDKTLPERAKADLSISQINVGTYNPLLGYSYNELSAHSRTQHKSQGFGSSPDKGDQVEYLEYLNGKFIQDSILHEDLLDSADKAWLNIGTDVDSLLSQFDFVNPDEIISKLLIIRKKVAILDSIFGRFEDKMEHLNKIIIQCLSVTVDLLSEYNFTTPGSELKLRIEAINRSQYPIVLKEVELNNEVFSWNRKLESNVYLRDTVRLTLADENDYSGPYWLKKPFENRFDHKQELLKNPDSREFSARVKLVLGEDEIYFDTEVEYKWTDRVKGGMANALRILPSLTLQFDRDVYFSPDSSVRGNVIIKSFDKNPIQGRLIFFKDSLIDINESDNINISAGSSVSVPFSGKLKKGDIKDQLIKVSFVSAEDTFNNRLFEINYDHIKSQSVLLPAFSKILNLKSINTSERIAYVEGPDNEMISYLKELGCNIETFSQSDLLSGKLTDYDVLLFGIRSLNVDLGWNDHASAILDFIKKGGLVVVQYQTSRDVAPVKFSPFPFNIGRNRVTNENSNTVFLLPEHSILNKPYKLSNSDFRGWNQERGLYFAENIDENFRSILAWNDDDEEVLNGSLIVGNYGKGAFVFTGISFFRHIPYGVPGSYKLLLNILSYKNTK